MTKTTQEEIGSKSDVAAGSEGRMSPRFPHAAKLYHNLVPAYKALWPAVAGKNIRSVVRNDIPFQPDEAVLEVGVGTGLSLNHYPDFIKLTGIDLSESMLAEAQDKIDRQGWDHINVLPMNAESLSFEDNSFDIVTSFHTVSVVSNADKMMSEIVRVCRPGGQVYIINHFRSENPLISRVVDSAGHVTRHLGWRTDVEFDELMSKLPLRIDAKYKPNPFSFFTIIHATCEE